MKTIATRLLRSVVMIAVLIAAVTAQTGDRDADIAQVQTAVRTLAGHSDKANFLLRDLNWLRGSVADHNELSFKVYPRKRKKGGITVLYSEVLAVTSKPVSLSLVPDPTTKPFASWNDLATMPVNRDVEIIPQSGSPFFARFRKFSSGYLHVINDRTGEDLVLEVDQVAAVFVVKHRTRNIGGSIGGGTQKGAEIGRDLATGNMGYGAAIGAGIGAIVGLLKGAVAKEGESFKVLVFSR